MTSGVWDDFKQSLRLASERALNDPDRDYFLVVEADDDRYVQFSFDPRSESTLVEIASGFYVGKQLLTDPTQLGVLRRLGFDEGRTGNYGRVLSGKPDLDIIVSMMVAALRDVYGLDMPPPIDVGPERSEFPNEVSSSYSPEIGLHVSLDANLEPVIEIR